MNKEQYSYVFELNYANRMNEIPFIKDILERYDNNSLTGANLMIGNNIYYPELYLCLNFEKQQDDFDNWLLNTYPDKKKKYNFFFGDVFKGISSKSFNSIGLGIDIVEWIITPFPNGFFLFPDKPTLDEIFPPGILHKKKERVFLCHASEDKRSLEILFEEFQKREVHTFMDKYEIDFGEGIKTSISQHLENTKIALVCYSKSFLKKESGWIKEELEYFNQNFIPVIPINVDLERSDIEKIVGEKKYVNLGNREDIDALVLQLKQELM